MAMSGYSAFQGNFAEQESPNLAGEIYCFDTQRAHVILVLEKEPCNRSKSCPVYQRTGVGHRLLPRRPRIGEKQQIGDEIQRWNSQKPDPPVSAKPDLSSSGARPKASVLKKSFSLEPELMSVARKRFLEIHGISTQLPRKLPPLSEKIPVAVSRNCSRFHHSVENNEGQRRFSVIDLPKSSDCKNIVPRANLGPLRANVSPKEKKEFEEWKRKFYEEIAKEINSKEREPIDHKAKSL